jgi:thioredoxin-related protein
MKKILLIATIVCAFFTMAFTYGDPLKIGDVMPSGNNKMQDVSGKEISLKEASGENGLLVMFSCNTCPFVVKNQQRTIAICDYAKKMKMGVIVLNSNEAKRDDDDSFDAMKKYYAEQKYNWYYALDKENIIADAFGANRTPECFLFDKDAKLVYHGAIDDNASDAENVTRNHLREAITEVVSGKEVSVKQSRSVGCTIKRKS